MRAHHATIAAVAALVLAGCGSATPAELPPAAGPAASPPLTATPAGSVHAQGDEPPAERVYAAGREFRTRGSRLEALRDRRVVASVPTCLAPVALAAADLGRGVAVLCGRERVLDFYDAATLQRLGRAAAGIGPTGLASDNGHFVYVTDTVGGAVLVFRLRPQLELTRRVGLPGGPYAIAYDDFRRALWITLTARNRLVKYAAGSTPVPTHDYASVRAPLRVDVDPNTARVTVRGGGHEVQVLDPPILTR